MASSIVSIQQAAVFGASRGVCASFSNEYYEANCCVLGDKKISCPRMHKSNYRQLFTAAMKDFGRKPTSRGLDNIEDSRDVLRRLKMQGQDPAGTVEKGTGCGRPLVLSFSINKNEISMNEEEEKTPESTDKNVQMVEPYFPPPNKQSNAAYSGKGRTSNEFGGSHKQIASLVKELQEVRCTTKDQQHTINVLKKALEQMQENLIQTKDELLKKSDALSHANLELKTQESKLKSSNEEVLKQSSEIDNLRACLKEAETMFKDSERERLLKQAKLIKTEEELANHANAFVDTQNKTDTLQRDTIRLKESNLALEQELDRCNSLLVDCQQELESTEKSITELEGKVEEQSLLVKRQEEKLATQNSLLHFKELNLKEAREALGNERELLRLARISYDELERELIRQKHVTEESLLQLANEKTSLREAIVKLSSATTELQKRDSALSEAQSQLQLMKTELIAIRLESQQISSSFSLVQLAMDERECALQAGRNTMEELRTEIAHLATLAKEWELKYLKTTTVLKEKEEQLKSISVDSDLYKVKLSEATSVVERVVSLSKELLECPKDGKASDLDEDTILMQTNYELFAANRALLETEFQDQHFKENNLSVDFMQKELEKELEALKLSMFKKDLELENVHKAFIEKEQELKQVLKKWELRENELSKLQNVVIAEAKTALSGLVQHQVDDNSRCALDIGHAS